MEQPLHPAATEHLPFFITPPGASDTLFTLAGITLVASVLAAGVFFFWLHSLPERMVHNKVQFDIVAVLALLSLFTHIHAFWIAALLIAFINFPDFSLPHFSANLGRIAGSLEKLADSQTGGDAPKATSHAAGKGVSHHASPDTEAKTKVALHKTAHETQQAKREV
jgi:hypothetical protein